MMDTAFERELIQKIAILETRMSQVYEEMKDIKTRPGITTKDKIAYGGLIAAVTTLINVLSEVIQNAI
jgi:hypothetical protein